MLRFLLGLATGYLTMTKDGKKLADNLIKSSTKELNSYLKQEGVIEPNKDVGHTQSDKSSSEFQEQSSTDETVNK